MTFAKREKIIFGLAIGLAIFEILCIVYTGRVRAMEFQEVKPYVFAEFPHGRIYKTVHEGCELYIVESDVQIPGGQYGTLSEAQHTYSITAGRGCK